MEEIMLPAIHLAELSTLSTRAFNAFSSLSRAHSTLHHERAFHRLSEVAQQFVSGASEMPFIMKIPPSFRLTKVTQTDFIMKGISEAPDTNCWATSESRWNALSWRRVEWARDSEEKALKARVDKVDNSARWIAGSIISSI